MQKKQARRLAKSPHYQLYLAVRSGPEVWIKIGVSDHVSLRLKKLNCRGGYGTHQIQADPLLSNYHGKRQAQQVNLTYADVIPNHNEVEWKVIRCFTLRKIDARGAGEIEHAIHVALEQAGLSIGYLASEEEPGKARRKKREPRPARCLEVFRPDVEKSQSALVWLCHKARGLRYVNNLNCSIGRYRGYKKPSADRIARLAMRFSKIDWARVSTVQ